MRGELTDEGGLEEVRPPEHLVHGADVADLVAPVLDPDDGGDAGHEDDGERAGERLDGGGALAGLDLLHPPHRQLPQRPDLDHEQQRHRALREQHQEQQRNHGGPFLPFRPTGCQVSLGSAWELKGGAFQRDDDRVRSGSFLPPCSTARELISGGRSTARVRRAVLFRRRKKMANESGRRGDSTSTRRRSGQEPTTTFPPLSCESNQVKRVARRRAKGPSS